MPRRFDWLLALTSASLLAAPTGCSCGDNSSGDGDDGDVSGPDAGSEPDAGGGEPDGGPESEIVICPEAVPAPSEGACDVTDGTGTAVLLRGTVLGKGVVYENGGVLYDGTAIVCVGCDCGDEPAARTATQVACAGSVISPALINPHDHMTFSEGSPIDVGETRYNHRHGWRGSLSTPSNPHGTGATGSGNRWVEVRQLLAGATAMVGSGSADGLIRNLDRLGTADEALGFHEVEFETFSLGDSNEQFRADCDWNYAFDEREAFEQPAFLPHVAEGIDDYAAEEFRCQSTSFGGGQDFTERNDSHIHGIGLGAADYARMANDGTRLIWSPRSNIALYGHTAMVSTFDRLGGVIALGTDWTYSGSVNMLRELSCADGFNRDQLAGHFSDEDLWKMATLNAAIATDSDAVIGSLEVGKLADIAVFTGEPGQHHRAVLEASNQDVVLVTMAGRATYGEVDVVAGLGETCEEIPVCEQTRAICLEREFGVTYLDLAAAVAAGTPAYAAIFCGVPEDEPTCVPSRPGEFTGVASRGDADGDGLAAADDNCPTVFNPVRPMDAGQQADADGDGEGDACDPTPIGDDIDGDRVVNADDNCPFDANARQTDEDRDDKGDTCDFCPAEANPAGICGIGPATEATIQEIQMGTVPEGTTVIIRGAVVTAVWDNGAMVQATGGGQYSGVHLFTGPDPGVVLGDVVDATGTVTEYFTDTEIEDAILTPVGTGGVATPVDLTVAQAADEAYEGVLVRLTDVTTVVNPYNCSVDNPACADANLWEVNGTIVVYDRMYQDADWVAQAGQSPVVGVMGIRFDRRRIMPRIGADIGPR